MQPLSRVPFLAIMILLGAICLASGCVRRRLTVRTDSPGAKVYVDNQEIGVSPVSTSFTYYGTREITVLKDGYRTEKLKQRFPTPWYQWPGIDFFVENLWPWEVRDERVVDVALLPQEVVDDEQILKNAENLRRNAREGNFTPLLQPETLPPPRDPRLGKPGEGLPGNEPKIDWGDAYVPGQVDEQ